MAAANAINPTPTQWSSPNVEAKMNPRPQAFTRNGFTITTQKLPILKAAIEHNVSGWGISFNTFDALDKVDKTGAAMLKVAYSKEWQKSRERTHDGIKEVVKPFDWSYSTDYKGTEKPDAAPLSPSDVEIPIELLKRPDPILFFDDVMLYEDELADNGISMLSCKIRVMPDRLLLLARFFMRLDNVVFRLRDTRIYVDFNKAEVIRDYQAREMGYEDVRKTLASGREDIAAVMRDPNRLAQILPIVDRSLERTSLASRQGGAAETYVSYGFTQKLYEACSSQADYEIPQLAQKGVEVPKTADGEELGVGEGWWYKELGLLPTFSTWSQVTFLHMYLLTVRIRALPSPESVRTHSRHLFDHFSHNAEQRMATLHNISSRSIRNKYLKDLFIQWRGVLAAYDEGLVKGDAVLGAAVWRNIWKASGTTHDGQDLDWAKVATVVAYMRRVLSELAKTNEADLVFDLVSSDSIAAAVAGKEKKAIFGPRSIDLKLGGMK
uniref:TIP41-like protein n=1 Tax=Talaromyces marneffei PM1 TaxID=1077442 RepID=A0A093XQN1_TALMA